MKKLIKVRRTPNHCVRARVALINGIFFLMDILPLEGECPSIKTGQFNSLSNLRAEVRSRMRLIRGF